MGGRGARDVYRYQMPWQGETGARWKRGESKKEEKQPQNLLYPPAFAMIVDSGDNGQHSEMQCMYVKKRER